MSTESEIRQVNDQIRELEAIRSELFRKLVDEICPLKVGEVIDIVGHSFRGKKGRVESVWATGKTAYSWKAKLIVLKKDGTDSVHSTIISQYQWEMKDWTPPKTIILD